MELRLEHVGHIYNPGTTYERRALDDVCMTIGNGEFIGLIGHTGSGKSTLVQHLNGLLLPSEGKIYADGEDISAEGYPLRKLRFRVGLVFQYPEYQLFESDVLKDISFGPKNQGLNPEEAIQRAREAMRSVGLDESYETRSPFELSGGQKRRAAIAGILAMNPEIRVLDEPTAGLDPRGRDRILGMLEELHARENVTILMVSHSMDDMARLASRLIVMSDGKVVADGTPREIFMQEEMMTSIGLDIPEAARLCARLRAKGYDLPADLFRPEQLKEQLLRIWKEGSAC